MDRVPRRSRERTRHTTPVGNREDSVVQQQFKEDCDINIIVRNFKRSGTLDHINHTRARYGDFTKGADYAEAHQAIQDADSAFGRLSAKIRTRFANDPALLLDFVADEANDEEGRELGLYPPVAVQPEKTTAPPPETPAKPTPIEGGE